MLGYVHCNQTMKFSSVIEAGRRTTVTTRAANFIQTSSFKIIVGLLTDKFDTTVLFKISSVAPQRLGLSVQTNFADGFYFK